MGCLSRGRQRSPPSRESVEGGPCRVIEPGREGGVKGQRSSSAVTDASRVRGCF